MVGVALGHGQRYLHGAEAAVQLAFGAAALDGEVDRVRADSRVVARKLHGRIDRIGLLHRNGGAGGAQTRIACHARGGCVDGAAFSGIGGNCHIGGVQVQIRVGHAVACDVEHSARSIGRSVPAGEHAARLGGSAVALQRIGADGRKRLDAGDHLVLGPAAAVGMQRHLHRVGVDKRCVVGDRDLGALALGRLGQRRCGRKLGHGLAGDDRAGVGVFLGGCPALEHLARRGFDVHVAGRAQRVGERFVAGNRDGFQRLTLRPEGDLGVGGLQVVDGVVVGHAVTGRGQAVAEGLLVVVAHRPTQERARLVGGHAVDGRLVREVERLAVLQVVAVGHGVHVGAEGHVHATGHVVGGNVLVVAPRGVVPEVPVVQNDGDVFKRGVGVHGGVGCRLIAGLGLRHRLPGRVVGAGVLAVRNVGVALSPAAERPAVAVVGQLRTRRGPSHVGLGIDRRFVSVHVVRVLAAVHRVGVQEVLDLELDQLLAFVHQHVVSRKRVLSRKRLVGRHALRIVHAGHADGAARNGGVGLALHRSLPTHEVEGAGARRVIGRRRRLVGRLAQDNALGGVDHHVSRIGAVGVLRAGESHRCLFSVGAIVPADSRAVGVKLGHELARGVGEHGSLGAGKGGGGGRHGELLAIGRGPVVVAHRHAALGCREAATQFHLVAHDAGREAGTGLGRDGGLARQVELGLAVLLHRILGAADGRSLELRLLDALDGA